ncbi:hypothetical protein EXIGLDRAFT_399956 [Exidia glandulosa HHB12029]|uniref:Uncharacterized protein n=1 Tax=Exidia glandulosa HHB12029 TaxID=1314781 RepID=A0A165KTI8_EXIGL|nr:hypothetical protein EXIGLDRAFT_399956 [Exidia glandulosa HHB12029]
MPYRIPPCASLSNRFVPLGRRLIWWFDHAAFNPCGRSPPQRPYKEWHRRFRLPPSTIMLHIDFPTVGDMKTPRGLFVVVELDPAASIDGLADTVAEDQVLHMKTAKRLAIAHVASVLNHTRLGALRLTLQLVGTGLPEQHSFAAVPISTRTATSITSCRNALVPSHHLPIDEPAFVHTAHTTDCTISRVYVDNPSNNAISRSDLDALIVYEFQDQDELQRLGDDALATGIDRDCASSASSSEDIDVDEYGNMVEYLPYDEGSRWSETPSDFLRTKGEPYFRMWLDLSVLGPEPGQPCTLKDELEELRRIQRGCMERATTAFETKCLRVDRWRSVVHSEAGGSESDDDDLAYCSTSEMVPCESTAEAERCAQEVFSDFDSSYVSALSSSNGGNSKSSLSLTSTASQPDLVLTQDGHSLAVEHVGLLAKITRYLRALFVG